MLHCQGYSNRVITEKLDLSVNTVRAHLKRDLKELHVRTGTGAVVRHMASKPSQRQAIPVSCMCLRRLANQPEGLTVSAGELKYDQNVQSFFDEF